MRLLSAFAVALIPAWGQLAALRNPRTSPEDVAAGGKIFRSHCAECHGIAGEGGRGPSLKTGVFFHGSSDAELFANISDGIPGTAMPGVFFSADQVWQIVAFVRSLSQNREAPPAGDPQRGARLFRQHGCLSCHLVRGEGGIQGPDLSVIGSQRSAAHLKEAILEPNARVLRDHWHVKIVLENGAAYSGFLLNEDTHTVQILDFQRGLQSLEKRFFTSFSVEKTSLMPSYRDKLTRDEVQDLVAYLWSLKRKGVEQ